MGRSMRRMYVKEDGGVYRPATLEEVREAAFRNANLRRGTLIQSSTDATDFLKAKLALLPYESFYVIYLSTQHHVLAHEELARGTIDQCRVYVREVMRRALEEGASAFIVAHNHPSGSLDPSVEDRKLTGHILSAAKVLEINFLDHLIVSDRGHFSMAEANMMREYV